LNRAREDFLRHSVICMSSFEKGLEDMCAFMHMKLLV
jgi:hypothetical protein